MCVPKVVKMENLFTLHHVNAYDTAEGDIVMDVCTYPNDVVVDSLDMDVVRDATARNAYNQQATVKVSTGLVFKLKSLTPEVYFYNSNFLERHLLTASVAI